MEKKTYKSLLKKGIKMCEVCEKGGCSACEPKNNTLQFASGKEIEEFYDNYSESMYVDPAESTPDELQ